MGPAADVEMGSLGPLQQQTDSNAYEVNGKGDGSSSGDPQQVLLCRACVSASGSVDHRNRIFRRFRECYCFAACIQLAPS